MCVKESSMVQGSPSNVFGCTPRTVRKQLQRCAVDADTFPASRYRQLSQALYREAVVWKHLTHPNIVPLLGITPSPLQLVSEWMGGGDLTEYVKRNANVDRLGLVGAPQLFNDAHSPSFQLSDVADGLSYLHSCDVIHGDLKGVSDLSESHPTVVLTPGKSSILVDNSGHARIAGFGFATVTQDHDFIGNGSGDHGPTPRWIAPEILHCNQGSYTRQADVFSFAMVVIEVHFGRSLAYRILPYALLQVFTSAVPFDDLSSVAATFAVMEGRRPPRPSHPIFTDELWALTRRCWDQDPNLRPETSEVLRVLRDV